MPNHTATANFAKLQGTPNLTWGREPEAAQITQLYYEGYVSTPELTATRPNSAAQAQAIPVAEPEPPVTTSWQVTPNAEPLPLPDKLTVQRTEIASFVTLQEWEGYVVALRDDVFLARLLDVTSGREVEDEEVELPLSDLASIDLARLKIGSIFRWSIGYEIKKGRQRKRTSQIVLRRLPMWREKDLADARDVGERRAGNIRWEP